MFVLKEGLDAFGRLLEIGIQTFLRIQFGTVAGQVKQIDLLGVFGH